MRFDTNLDQILLLGLLGSATHWIVARSTVMSWFWGSARGWFAKLLACPACSGFWIGLGLGIAGVAPVEIRTVPLAELVLEPLTAGVLGVYLTPVFESVFLWGLSLSAIEPLPDDTTNPTPPAEG